MRGIATTLGVISDQSTAIHLVSLGINRKLETLEQVLCHGQGLRTAIHEMPLALALPNFPSNPNVTSTSFTRPLIGTAHGRLGVSAGDYGQAASKSANCSRPLSVARLPAPASILEMSPSFRPAHYTNCDPTPNLVNFCDMRVTSTQRARVVHLGMFYQQQASPGHMCRHWTRMTLRITVTRESRYWNMHKMRASALDPVTAYSLPTGLLKALERSLESRERFGQDSCLSVHLDSDSSQGHHVLALESYSEPPNQVMRCLQQITIWTRHMNCPRYHEQDLEHQPLNPNRPTNWYIAFLDSRWVMETRFGPDLDRLLADLYVLQVLHCLQGTPGIAKFTGVVLDRSGLISAFLSELPTKGKLCRNLSDDANGGQRVSWQRRERWCKQVVQAVAAVHRAAFVVGNMCKTPDLGIAIDAEDNAVLYGRFQRDFLYNETHVGSLPPEYWHSVSHGSQVEACPQSDIYQLGLALWGLASSWPATFASRSWLCKQAACTATVPTMCTEPHADPIQLQSPSEDTPEYLRLVIAACRAENPDDRPAAWELLELFPPEVGNDVGEEPTKAKQFLTRPEVCYDKFGAISVCDICNCYTGPRKFYCEVCSVGNYDICPACFDSGKHCLELHHLLAEHLSGTQLGRCYTDVKANGLREVVTS